LLCWHLHPGSEQWCTGFSSIYDADDLLSKIPTFTSMRTYVNVKYSKKRPKVKIFVLLDFPPDFAYLI
jgi:hypothetical protein